MRQTIRHISLHPDDETERVRLNTHARLADSNTPRELARSQNVQLGAILGRFGDVAEAVEYCRGICSETTNSRLALEYGGYLRALVGIGVSV